MAVGLLLDLDVLMDDITRSLVASLGKAVPDGIEAKLALLRPDLAKMPWARYRVVELSAIRNCIVHCAGKWEPSQINRLVALGFRSYEIPVKDTKIELRLGHLFPYKTAVRHVLTKCQQAVDTVTGKPAEK